MDDDDSEREYEGDDVEGDDEDFEEEEENEDEDLDEEVDDEIDDEEENEEEEEEVKESTGRANRQMKKTSATTRRRKLQVLLLSKYESVRKTTEQLGWSSYLPEDCKAGSGLSRRVFNVCWCDSSVTTNRVMKLGRMQKINHFPGMLDLVRKAGTAWNLNKMLSAVGKSPFHSPKHDIP